MRYKLQQVLWMTSLLFKRDLAHAYDTAYTTRVKFHSVDILRMVGCKTDEICAIGSDIYLIGYFGDLQCIKHVLDNFKSPLENWTDYEFFVSPMVRGAARAGRLNVVNSLYTSSADNWDAVLCEACCGGHLRLIKHAIRNGAQSYSDGFIDACSHGQLYAAQYLRSSYPISEFSMRASMSYAKKNNHINIIQYLQSLGVINTDHYDSHDIMYYLNRMIQAHELTE